MVVKKNSAVESRDRYCDYTDKLLMYTVKATAHSCKVVYAGSTPVISSRAL